MKISFVFGFGDELLVLTLWNINRLFIECLNIDKFMFRYKCIFNWPGRDTLHNLNV